MFIIALENGISVATNTYWAPMPTNGSHVVVRMLQIIEVEVASLLASHLRALGASQKVV